MIIHLLILTVAKEKGTGSKQVAVELSYEFIWMTLIIATIDFSHDTNDKQWSLDINWRNTNTGEF